MMVITPNEVMGSGHCIVCEVGIDRRVQTMAVDTLYDIELPGHYLDGRKYVCQGCVSDIVRSCGLMQATEVQDLKNQLATFKVAYQALLDGIKNNSSFLGGLLNDLPVVPDVNFASPSNLVMQVEAVENAKPKRGRPAKEPF